MLKCDNIINWVIYKITSPSNKIYIGKTADFKKRVRHYKYGDYKGQTRLYSSFVKYGYDSHEIKIIDEFKSDKEYAAGKEMFWIKSFMSNYCKWPECEGLNLTEGGEGNNGYIQSENSKRKRKESMKGKWGNNMRGKKHSAESIEKMRESQIDRYSKMTKEDRKIKYGGHHIGATFNRGRKHTEETKKKFRDAKLGKPMLHKQKPIIQYSLTGEFIKEYDSPKFASLDTGIHASTIAAISRGVKSKKYLFKYK